MRQQIITDQQSTEEKGQDDVINSFTTLVPNPDLLKWDSEALVAQGVAHVKFGWLKVPISHEDEGNVFDVKHACLRVRAVTEANGNGNKQAMFMHCGGPGSGRGCDMGIDARLLKKYDVITMNQRGHSIFGDNGGDKTPPVCPFMDSKGIPLEAYPVIACDELTQPHNFKRLPEWTEQDMNSPLFNDVIGPAAKYGIFSLLEGPEENVRWAYRLAKLNYNLCYKNARYFLYSSKTGRVGSAFDFTGTTNLVHDMNIFRKAIGAPKLTCHGGSYGTQVCSNYATIFPQKTDKLILDGNVEPRPDVISLADEGAEGPMAVFRGIAAACEASLTSEDPEEVCPMAPFMAEKVQAAMKDRGSIKAALLGRVWGSFSGQKDVPCSSVMMSCMSFIMKGGSKPAGCNNALGNKIEQALGKPGMSLFELNQMFDDDEPKRKEPVSAISTDVEVVRQTEYDHLPKYAEYVPRDSFGMAEIMAVTAMDTHGRLTEEGVIKWWKDAGSRFTMGLSRALFFGLGVSIWPAVPTPVPPAGDSKLKPLIIGNLRDLQTSYLATQRMKQGFPQGRLLTYQGYGHCLGPGWGDNMAAEKSCLKHVHAYLYDDILPEDGSTCAVITTAQVSKRHAEAMAQTC